MQIILQIGVDGNMGSTGRIAESIGKLAIAHGWESYIAHGRFFRPSQSKIIKIGSTFGHYVHGLKTRILDQHGLGSKQSTIELIKQIEVIQPSVIHLHNLHGYYLNIEILFNYLSYANIPVIWTFHDCWAITGHCSHFDFVECDKWKTECHHCPQKRDYPTSWIMDRSRENYKLKKRLFNSVPNLTVVSVSHWLNGVVEASFMSALYKQVIYNGVDIDIFSPSEERKVVKDKWKLNSGFIILGVAGVWPKQKGLADFIELSKRLDKNDIIILVGLNKSQMQGLPPNVISIPRTESQQDLKELYIAADVFLNLSVEETFGLTTAEALACGTPAIVYNSTACPEIIDLQTGIAVKKKDINELFDAVKTVKKNGKSFYSTACRERAVKYFDKNERFAEYINLYERILEERGSESEKLRNIEDDKVSEPNPSKNKPLNLLSSEPLILSTAQPLNVVSSEHLTPPPIHPLNLLTSNPLNLLPSQPASQLKPYIMKTYQNYRICSNCIMDTSDPKITFDERGWCDYCRNYHKQIVPNWHPNEQGMKELQPLIDKIKKEGKGKSHDCLIGLSGGIDSSYVAYLAKEKFGLRPMLFHVDAGWNSQEAVNNIEKLVDGLGLDLYTEVINWEEMKDLQLAFFKAQVPHIDTPQDHAFFAGLYNFAAKHKQKYIFTGANYSTECVREPLEWHYHASDLAQLKDIHKKFGSRPLKTFPTADIFTYKLYYRYFKGIQIVKPLNHVPFIKEEAMDLLVEQFGWQKYLHKHYESRFTRFYEGYWLPTKFGYQKHRAHYSSLILTGQMTREDALDRISKPAYDSETIALDFEYIAKKLEITVSDLQALMDGENKTYRDYKNNMAFIELGVNVSRLLGIQKSIIR